MPSNRSQSHTECLGSVGKTKRFSPISGSTVKRYLGINTLVRVGAVDHPADRAPDCSDGAAVYPGLGAVPGERRGEVMTLSNSKVLEQLALFQYLCNHKEERRSHISVIVNQTLRKEEANAR
jgi:hypothetical protein